jgi:hypothetical protein
MRFAADKTLTHGIRIPGYSGDACLGFSNSQSSVKSVSSADQNSEELNFRKILRHNWREGIILKEYLFFICPLLQVRGSRG